MDYSLESILSHTKNRNPDFGNLLKVLERKEPSRFTLFEFFLNDPLEQKLAGFCEEQGNEEDMFRRKITAFRNAGYDYTTIHASNFHFKRNEAHKKSTTSANEGFVIFDRDSYDKYIWEKPLDYYDGRIEKIEKYLPDGMKFIVCGPGGVLENVIGLVGYDNLCLLIYDDPELVEMVFDKVGSSLAAYYEQIASCGSVGAIISNDDWGFNTQTMLSTADMRKYVFPWHKKIAQIAKDAGKPVILHSCGNLSTVWDDIIDDIGYDARHSYEDVIKPVEDMYDFLKGKITVLGGIDVDFICRSSLDDIYSRSRQMLEKTNCSGYALGTGNSVPEYLSDERYFAMIAAALY